MKKKKSYKINQRIYIHPDGYGKINGYIEHSQLFRVLFKNGHVSYFDGGQLKEKVGQPPPVSVKNFEGKEVHIKNYQNSLRKYPTQVHAIMDDYGNTGLCFATFRESKCGCAIVGCGTLQFPLMIKKCKKHK